jgi:hypothetical protein
MLICIGEWLKRVNLEVARFTRYWPRIIYGDVFAD